METKYSPTDHSAVSDRALSLPHFDEDATLLSARPVVPLHEVKAETRSKRGIIFGLTILAAILLGAISATLLLMAGGQNAESAAEAGLNQPTVSSSAAAGGSTSESAEVKSPVLAEPSVELPREVLSARDPKKKRATAATSRKPITQARADLPYQARDENFESDERELRQGDRRNARREARRRLRNRRERSGDDLLRIREIFEGYQRP